MLPLTLLLAAGCASVIPAWPRERASVVGVVKFQKDGTALLLDCHSQRQYLIGDMTRGNYLRFRQRTRQLAGTAGRHVTAEVSGYLERTGKGRIIEQPAILALAQGHCVAFNDPAGDYD